jgi:dodecin
VGDVARVTEIMARSSVSFEDAIRTGLERATKTIRGVEGAWIKEQKVAVSGDKVTSYQVTMLVTFVVDADEDLA